MVIEAVVTVSMNDAVVYEWVYQCVLDYDTPYMVILVVPVASAAHEWTITYQTQGSENEQA